MIKLILSRGVEHGPTPTAWVTSAQAADFREARERGIRVVTLDRGYDSAAPARAPWLLLGAKTLSYAVNMAAIREAQRRGADDAIFVSSDGMVLEAPTASVILRFGDRFVTPEPAGAILHGTTQVSLFEHLAARATRPPTRPSRSTRWAGRMPRGWCRACGSRPRSPPWTAPPVTLDAALTADFNRYLLSPRD